MDELDRKSGIVKSKGKVAYVPQNAFLLNASFRDNISFGCDFDMKKYEETVVKCRLVDDLETFAGGDLTEIGERGINLSGGQKQRVSLARAVYSDSDIYLIDDALSALDAEVGKQIFNGVFKKKLKGKTILLVTHASYILDQVDKVLVMRGGEVVVSGHFNDIKDHPEYKNYSETQKKQEKKEEGENSSESAQESKKSDEFEMNSEEEQNMVDFAENTDRDMGPIKKFETCTVLRSGDLEFNLNKDLEYNLEEEYERLRNLSLRVTEKRSNELKKAGTLTVKETKKKGFTGVGVYLEYFRNFNWGLVTLTLILYLIYASLRVFSDFWLSYWAEDVYPSLSYSTYPKVYSYLALALFISLTIRAYVIAKGAQTAGYKMNTQLMTGLFKRPLSFFDTTPIGVVLNRATRDMGEMDLHMPNMYQHLTFNSLHILSIFVVIAIGNPIIIIFFIVMLIWYFVSSKDLSRVTVDLKRVNQLTNSPLISVMAESVRGSTSLRAYEKVSYQGYKYTLCAEATISSKTHLKFAETFFYVKVEMIMGGLAVILTCVAVVLAKTTGFGYDGSPEASTNLALGLTWVTAITDWIAFTLFSLNIVSQGMSSAERIFDYATPGPDEVERESIQDGDKKLEENNWPQTGDIKATNVACRYRPGLPRVLKGLDFEIQSTKKIGIVGRTGSGKSTLILNFKRILELDNLLPGEKKPLPQLVINSIDISKIGLRLLRKSITLIPQDPFLLQGTIKYNLDPYEKFTEEEIISVLRKTRVLDSLQSTLARKQTSNENIKGQEDQELNPKSQNSIDKILNFQLESKGSNLSLGQRQLLSISRAILSKPKILLMDEATANIDTKTDSLIQKLIKYEFPETTILTIAHRLNTIIQYDKILVLDQGTIQEFDTPVSLLENSESLFTKLIQGQGEEFYKKMMKMAHDKNMEDDGTTH